jgi:hypothetical protein
VKADDYLRSFGMSGFVITEELRNLENSFNISLGHLPRTR